MAALTISAPWLHHWYSGFKNTGVSGFLPTFTEDQLSNMPDTLVRMLVQSILSLTSNVMQSLDLHYYLLPLVLDVAVLWGTDMEYPDA